MTANVSRLLYASLWLISAGAAEGNNSKILGVSPGVIYDGASHSIRRVLGVPGAAYLQEPLVSNVAFASVSPDGSMAIAVRGEYRYLISRLDSPTPGITEMGPSQAVTNLSWSPNSQFAAVWSEAAIELLEINEGHAEIVTTVGVSNLAGRIAAVLPANNGQYFVIALFGEGLLRMSRDGGTVLLEPVPEIRSMVFLHGDKDVLFLDPSTSSIVEVQEWQSSQRVLRHNIDSSIPAATTLCLSRDNALLVMAGTAPALEVYDLATHTVRKQVPLRGPVRALHPLPSGDILTVLGGDLAGSVDVLEMTGDFQVFFLPAAQLPSRAPDQFESRRPTDKP